MKYRRALSAAVICSLLTAVPAAAEPVDGPEAQLIASKGASVVSVAFVLQMRIDIGGRIQERERNSRTQGLVVGTNGLIMVPSQVLNPTVSLRRPGRRRARATNVKADSVATNIRVTFPGDEKEYPAIVGATDSKTGLAFLLIDELGTAKPQPLDVSTSAAPRIGQTLFGVGRLGQTFDHAPICQRTRVIGKVTKPRTMWVLEDSNRFIGKPLFAADGAVAGICAVQGGGEGPPSARPFLLPLPDVQKVILRAADESKKALADVRERRAEEEAEAEEEGDAESEGDGEVVDPESKDGDKGDSGKGDGEK